MIKILCGATMLCLAIILIGINRGFDISDEGLYLLLANPLQENQAGIFNYDLFFKALFRFTGYTFSLVQLRLLRLLTYILAALALAGFWKNISGQPKIKSEILWISCLGLFLGYAFLPPTLSYNSLTVVLTSFWLFLITKEQKSFPSILLLGFLLAVWVYVKITLVMIFLPLTFLILIFWKKVKPIYSLGLILPFLALELLFLLLFEENAFLRLQQGIPLNTQRDGYQIGLMVKSIAVGGFWMVLTGAIFAGIAFCRNRESSLYPAMKIIAAFSLLPICYLTHITEEWNHLFLLAWAGFFGYQAGIGAFKPSKINLWFLLLILLPFFLHFGSNVPWLRIGIHYLVFWVLAARWIRKDLTWEVNLGTGLLAVFLVFNGIWWHPFGHEKPLWSHKIEWEIEEGAILIDPELAQIASEISDFNRQFSHSQILAAYRIPGLASLTGVTIPLSPTVWEQTQLSALFREKPSAMVYNKLEDLPENWTFRHHQDLGIFRSDTLQLLWD